MTEAELIAENAALRSENERLGAENRKLSHILTHQSPGGVLMLMRQIAERESELAQLKEALRPFADFARRMDADEEIAPHVDDYTPMTRWLMDPQMQPAAPLPCSRHRTRSTCRSTTDRRRRNPAHRHRRLQSDNRR